MLLGEFESTLQITETALAWIKQNIDRSSVRSPIAGIIFGKWNTESAEHWTLGVYDRNTVEGWLVKAPQLEFVIVQDFVLPKLNGKTLRVDSQGIAIE